MGTRPRVVLTGAPGSLGGLDDLLRDDGLEVEEAPLLQFSPATSLAPLESAVGRLDQYGAIAVTSPRAVEPLLAAVRRQDMDLHAAPVVWTGAACLSRLREVFPTVRSPSPSGARPVSLGLELASAMIVGGVRGPVLFPCGEAHREELIVRLRAAGRRVDPVVVYRAELATPDRAAHALAGARIVVVTSPRVAELVAAAVPAERRPSLVAIGPTTARTAAAAGWAPDSIAASPATAAIAAAVHTLLLGTP